MNRPAGEDVELGELLRRLDGVAQRQHVPDDADLHAPGAHDDGSGQDSAGGIDIEVGEVVLVDQGTVKTEVFADGPLVEVLLVRLGRQLRVAEPVGEPCLRADVVRNARVGGLIEGVELHLTPSSRTRADDAAPSYR